VGRRLRFELESLASDGVLAACVGPGDGDFEELLGGYGETDRMVRSVRVTVPRRATRLQEFLRAYYYR